MTDSYPTRLKEILRSEGRSQTWLGLQLSPAVTRSVICEWVSGSRTIPNDRRAQIADALGRGVQDVFPKSEREAA